jgi:hypothetical protein
MVPSVDQTTEVVFSSVVMFDMFNCTSDLAANGTATISMAPASFKRSDEVFGYTKSGRLVRRLGRSATDLR